MKTQIETITPRIAEQYLTTMTTNRSLKSSVISRYADDMIAGRWVLTHQGIAFDENGSLCDGQHRLQAIIKSGVSVSMVVTRGVDPTAIFNLDNGVGRTFRDSETIAGNPIPAAFPAALRSMYTLERTKGNAAIRAKFSSHSFLRSLADVHYDAVMFSLRCFSQSVNNHTHGVYSGPVLGVVARAFYTQDHDRLESFGLIMRTGMTTSIQDSAAITFRNWKISAAPTGSVGQKLSYLKCESALIAFLEKRPLSKLYKREEEFFPVPTNDLGI